MKEYAPAEEVKFTVIDQAAHEIRMAMRERFYATDELYGTVRKREVGLSDIDEIVYGTIDELKNRDLLDTPACETDARL